MPEAKRKLAAILSADVSGYSRLMGDDERATLETLDAYRVVFSDNIAKHDGRVVDTAGDSVLAVFDSVVEAVGCAAAVQKELTDRNAALAENRQMHFRIGVNLGDVIVKDDGTIYGDGVNVAARLESLAEPGGVTVSEDAYRQVEGKTDLGFQDIGEQEVKNIARPVRAYQVLTDGAPGTAPRAPQSRRIALIAAAAAIVVIIAGVAVWQTTKAPPEIVAEPVDPVLALPTGPVIAVLPFTNMSGDPEQEYFSDGLTDDIITDLSQLSQLMVIARNSTFVYKGRAVDIREVGRDLGATYVLEGGVRRAEGRVRINAQLIDVRTGQHVWAERYDRDLTDVFALQDDISHNIVGALELTLSESDRQRLDRPETNSPEAHDAFLRGRSYFLSFTREGNIRARESFEQALKYDPDYARAHAWLGWADLIAWLFQWSDAGDLLDRAVAAGRKAIQLNPEMAIGHTTFGWASLWQRHFDRAISSLELAVALEPSDAMAKAFLAESLNYVGRPERAPALMRAAIRLDPQAPHYPFHMGHAYFLMAEHDKAIEWITDTLARTPNFLPGHSMLAVIYSELGRMDEARAAVAEMRQINRNLSATLYAESLPYKDPAVLTRFLDGLRKAGLDIPDEPSSAE